MNKKFRSYVLCIILLSSLTWFSLIQVTEADNPLFAGGSGTESDPYQICTVEQLQNMNQDLDAYYVLVCDIDASETINWNNGKGFKPIAMDGSSDYAFQGTRFTGNLDGRGYAITGLYINRPSLDFVGLIGHHLSGTISNIGLVDCDITGNNRVGGLIGHNKGPVKNCYVTGKVNGNTYVGGFTGRFQQSTSDYFEITNSYAIVEVNGYINVGGFIGYKPGGILVNCYSAGPVTGNYGVGGFVASKTHGASTNCFWDTETSGQSSSAGGTGKTTSEMKDVATYTDTSNTGLSTPWDFVNDPNDDTANEDIWSIDLEINNGYPYLGWQNRIITATININPQTLNLRSKGKWITCYIELPTEYDIHQIKVETIKLNNQLNAEINPTQINDYDKDYTPDLMVKFDRQEIQNIVETNKEIEVTITGELTDFISFSGRDTIRTK